MNSADKRIEELLNRAGQTISDLPKDYQDAAECMRAYAEVQKWRSENNLSTQHECEKYILHLTDIIDRMETALENLLNLKDRHVHIVSNVDAPEGLTQEQYFTAAEAIIDATDKYRAGLEPWDDWSADDEQS